MKNKDKQTKREKWSRIEKGLEEDDFSSPFLTHFGFMDYPTKQPSLVKDETPQIKSSSQRYSND